MAYGKLKKEITIGFRTDREIRSALESIAEEQHQSISHVIETILYARLKEMKSLQAVKQEQRQYARKQVALPAFILDAQSDGREFKTAKVLDVSLGGIQLSIPQGLKFDVSTDNATSEFRIVFTLPEATRPINVTCQSKRVYESGDDVHIGATIVDSDFSSYQTLQRYLM